MCCRALPTWKTAPPQADPLGHAPSANVARLAVDRAEGRNSNETLLLTDALIMAIWRRGKPDSPLHHSDRLKPPIHQRTVPAPVGRLRHQLFEGLVGQYLGQCRDRELLQNSDDLLFRKAAALHVLVLSMGQNELQSGLERGGNVMGYLSPVEFEEEARLA